MTLLALSFRSVLRGRRLIGVLDIDSDRPDAFTDEDATRLAAILEEVFGHV